MAEQNYCKCGCGEIIPFFGSKGRRITCKFGHRWPKAKVKKRTAHERANRWCKKEQCFFNDENCLGQLEIHHIDKNPFNNEKSNLICLCRSHHRIADWHGLDAKYSYRVDGSGKRRYTWEK